MLMFLFVSLSLTLHDNVLSSHKLCLTVCCSFLNLSVKSNLMVSVRQQVFACGFVVCVQIDYYQQQDHYTLRLSSFCVLFKASTSSTTKTRIFLSKQYQSKYTFPFRAFNKPRVSGVVRHPSTFSVVREHEMEFVAPSSPKTGCGSRFAGIFV